MNPLPLTIPDGTILGWVCSTCGSTRALQNPSAWTSEGPDRAFIAKRLEHPREMAERCCTCRGCGVPLPWRSGFPRDRCEPCAAQEDARRAEAARQNEAKYKRYGDAYEAALARAKDREIALYLRSQMEDWSEALWCAGWMSGLERRLWTTGEEEGPVIRGMGDEDVTEGMAQLRFLADRAGGWWHWPDGADGPLFITLDDWRALLAGKETP